VDSQLGRWQGKNQPPATGIDGAKLQDSAKEHPIRFGILAVEKNMSSRDQAREFSTPVSGFALRGHLCR
jgi:hypothetical protein